MGENKKLKIIESNAIRYDLFSINGFQCMRGLYEILLEIAIYGPIMVAIDISDVARIHNKYCEIK